MTALGEISSPGTHHHPFPCVLSAALWEAPAAGLGGILEVTASHLTEAETEAQAREANEPKSQDKVEKEVE